jgi:hypothetical protein
MANLVYSIPTWPLGLLIVGLAATVSALGLTLVHRVVPLDVRRTQNDVAGYISNIAAFVYAVVLAFLAVAVWQEYGDAQATAQLEANLAGDIYYQAEGYPEPFRRRIRAGIAAYVDAVIEDEWPRQARGATESPVAWTGLAALYRDLLTFEPRDMRERLVHTEQLRSMHRLFDHRRTRIYQGSSGLHPVVWTVILIGSVLIVAFAYFMGTGNFRAHMAMTAFLGASIGLVIFLIVALDYPFRGDIGIKPDAFVEVREHLRRFSGP